MDENEIQYQQVQEQREQFQRFLEDLTAKRVEVRAVISALEEVQATRVGKGMLVPVASGIFLMGELKENSEVIVNVGSGVCTRKSIDETKKLLKAKLTNLEKHMEEVASVMNQLDSLESELKKMQHV